MPRAESPPPKSNLASLCHPLGVPQHPNVLKRNQACHQCRRRKLKWCAAQPPSIDCKPIQIPSDANRPCSTCVRSHAHAASHAPPGVIIPPLPDCTFDEKLMPAVTEVPRNKYERLENRITELESLLRQKDHALMNLPQTRLSADEVPQRQPFNDIIPGSQDNASNSASPTASLKGSSHSSPKFIQDLMWPHWPQDLPTPELLKHLVEVFFLFHPHASKLFHVPTFMSAFALNPTHPRFPSTPLLHAICAIGSLYTAAVTSPPLPDFDQVPPDEIFLERLRVKEKRPDSFAEQHAKWAREKAEHMNTLGENLFQVFQAQIILTWFYWSHGRWVDVFIGSAHSMRLSIPLGLNMCPPFNSITKSERPHSILNPARSVIEDEMRRNAFWLAYAIDRQHGCGNGWAMSLDDQDISQLLPIRNDQFEQGILIPPLERQWAHSRDVLFHHPEHITDSFGLYVKGTILISKIKSFNMRFRSKHFAGDISMACPTDEFNDPIDPRGSPAFIELDHLASSFTRSNFPPHLRNPIVDGVVDNQLYTAFLLPHVATIILHDPHAETSRSACTSALKILTAARAILDLIYDVSNTSYDITLLDSFCSFCWFLGGRILARFLQVAIDNQKEDQIITFRTELQFIYSSIAKVGHRIPLAHRFARMLREMIEKSGSLDSTFADFPSLPQPRRSNARFVEEISDFSNARIGLHKPYFP